MAETVNQSDTLPAEAPEKRTVGAVLVVGAGIAGMQAALNLADAGLKVFLIDKAPAIGGTMAGLDKTFPTNDCAMCILSPKLVEAGRHLNIELLTGAQLEALHGEAGNFTAVVRQQPRYVDIEKCTGCGECTSVCPVSRPDEFNGGLSLRKAIYKPYPQAIPNAYVIEKAGTAPCRDACPIHQRVQGYLALVSEGRFADAFRTILEENPFPSICGRVCNHRCEENCSRKQWDASLNIMGLKRFVADWAWEHRAELPDLLQESAAFPAQGEAAPLQGRRVAIVGAGPAGLTCADDLARQGCAVTVFEALPVPGGMMRAGIPAYRLPPEVIQRDIDRILARGIDLRLNQRVEHAEALLDEFEAVFVSIGAHQGVKLPIPGSDLPGVLLATEFLRTVNLSGSAEPSPDGSQEIIRQIQGRRVLVLGGGNVAVDAAATAIRLGASWTGMTCLEDREQMPAYEWEIQDALAEGVQIFPSRTFKEIISREGRAAGVRTAQVHFRGFVNGQPDFDEIPDTEEIISADVVIFAIGQRPDPSCLKEAEVGRGGRIRVDPRTLATSVKGVFAGGDAVTGTTTIVEAIAAGHQAAASIKAFLTGAEFIPPARVEAVRLSPAEVQRRILDQMAASLPRQEAPKRPPEARKTDFGEIFGALSEVQARLEASRCLRCGICSECNQCAMICRAGAIQHQDAQRLLELNVGAVILTPGLEPMPGDVRPEYGYGRYPNVVTHVQFERMLSASGPYGGVIQRPSDQTHPRKIAWIQCVGSRDCGLSPSDQRASYCSAICCMAAVKEAVIAREHSPEIQPTIFYMDLRSFGKGFEAYLERAQREYGVRTIRCMISEVRQVPGSQNLLIRYAKFTEGNEPPNLAAPIRFQEEEFDLVVLSTGLRPSAEALATAERIGLEMNEFGFVQTQPYAPTHTSRPGVFTAGTFAEPKDIPESIIEASCAAAEVSALLSPARGSLTRKPTYPPQRDISDEPERVGVFICHCGINIGAVVDVPAVTAFARTLPGVVYAEHNLYTCSQDTQQRIVQTILEHSLNRVVVASCTPRTHEPLFQDTLRQAGLNPSLFEMANIREQDAWVHRMTPEEATEKACQLVAMAVAKSRRLRPIQRVAFDLERSALVIGGGLAGMTAALSIARQGFEVYLVEHQDQLGGHLRHVQTGHTPRHNPQKLLADLTAAVAAQPRLHTLTQTKILSVSGYPGQYQSIVQLPAGDTLELRHGVIVVATGGQPIQPTEFGYPQFRQVMTQTELEEQLQEPKFVNQLSGRTLTMIQCVGSRQESHPYCSRVCCTQALKNSLAVKAKAPNAQILVLYRDLRSYGFREALYHQARQVGVIFLRYDEKSPPEISPAAEDRLLVSVLLQPEHSPLTYLSDWVVLSTGIEPLPENPALAQMLKIPLNEDGFFQEAHVKLRPVDFASEGIFIAGLAHSPRSIEETISQAQAAAVRAVALLTRPQLEAPPIAAEVNPRLCAACGLCVEVCPYGARLLEPGWPYAQVIEVLCQGCGACVAACPNKASQQKGFELKQMIAMLEAVSL